LTKENLNLSTPIYEVLFNSIEEGFLIANKRGEIVMANPRACELFGYKEGELIGYPVESLIPMSKRDGHKKLRGDFQKQPQKRSMGAGMNLSALRKDGTTFYVEISLNHVDIDGEKYISALISNVSKRVEQERQIKDLNSDLEAKVRKRTIEVRESQKLHSAIARNFPNGIINVFDRDLNYIFVDGKELFQMGIKSERLIGTNYLEKIAPEIRPQIKEALLGVFNGAPIDFEIEFKGHFYRINAVPLALDSGEINRILVVERNITEQKKFTEQQEAALENERSLNKMKSRFVSMASHEFRTPLSTVLSSTSLIEKYIERKMYEKTEKHTNRIKKSVHGLTEILNDFLSVDKLETQITPVKKQTFEYKQFANDIIEDMTAISKEGQTIHVDIRGTNDEIHTDPGILKNILYNLMSNAIKYSSEGKVIQYISTVSDTTLTIDVIDEGIGIPKSDQKELFTRFFRAKNATNIKGTGLGLNIVKKYLELLEGNMTFESQENKCTRFTIRIPINQEES